MNTNHLFHRKSLGGIHGWLGVFVATTVLIAFCSGVWAQGTVPRPDLDKGDKRQQRLQYLRHLRGDTPEGNPPEGGIGLYLQAFNQVQGMLGQKALKEVEGNGWQSLGPSAVPNGQKGDLSLGISISGRVTSVAVHPTNSSIIYIGTASGGAWKSTNGGASWTLLTRDEPTQSIGDLTLDPQQPNTVWVGTGESFNTGQSSSFFGLGLLRSTNGGNTWQHFPGPFASGSTLSRIRRVAVDRNDSNTVIFADKSGLYRVTNALSDTPTFTNLDPGGTWWDILQDAGNPGTWFGTRSAAGGGSDFVQVTNIGGVPTITVLQTWSGAYTIGATNGNFAGRSQITQCAATPGTLYAIVEAPPAHRVFRSTTSGTTWQDADPTLASSMRAGSVRSQAFYDLYITVDPTNANNVVVGDVLLFRSTNATNANPTWEDLTEAGPTDANIHWDNHDGLFMGSTFFACTDGGIFRSPDILAGSVVWNSLNNGITSIQVNQNAFSYSPAAGNESMIVGTQDNGTLRRDNAPGTVTWRTLGSGDGGFCFYSPNSGAGDNAYQSYIAGSMSYSTNMNAAAPGFGTNQLLTGQAPFSPNTSGSDGNYFSFYPNAIISPVANPDRVVVTGGQSNATNAVSARLWYHNNAASAPGGWVDISTNVPNRPGDEFDALAFSPTNANVLYIGEANQVFRTNDITANPPAWQQIGTGTLPNKVLTDIAVDPNNDGHLVVVYSGYDSNMVFETQNANAGAAATWFNRTGNLPAVPLFSAVIDNTDSAEWYVGGDLGVWRTTNRGSTWDLVGNGMPMGAAVFDLKIDPNRNELLAATFGSGVWMTTLCDAQVTIAEASPVITCTETGGLASLTIHGTAGSAGGNVIQVEYRLDPPDPVAGFGPWIEAQAAPLPNKFADWVAALQLPVGRTLFQVRVTTDSGASCSFAIRDLIIQVLDVSPMVTIEAPSIITVCDDVADVEIHGFAASCEHDPIDRIEFSTNAAGPFGTTGVSVAAEQVSFVNYVIHLGAPGSANIPSIIPPAAPGTLNPVFVRAVTVSGIESAAVRVDIEALSVVPAITIEEANPLDVCISDSDVEIHGFAQSCPADPIHVVEFSVNGGAFAAVDQVATLREGYVSWVLHLGAPNGVRLPTNNTEIRVRARTLDNDIAAEVTTHVRWPRIAIQDTNLTLTGPAGSGLGVQPHIMGSFTVAEVDGFVKTKPIHLALQGILVPADGSDATIGPENIDLIPAEFELEPGQSQLITVQVSIPLNSSFGPPLTVPPLPGLVHGPAAIRARGECVNPVQTNLQVTVTPYRDPDLIRRGFPTFCGDCAPSHWQMFAFPVTGLGEPYNPIFPVNYGSTLRNQLEDDFGLINMGAAPFHAVRWDPVRGIPDGGTNLSFARYNPPKPLLEPTTIILPGEAFSMARRIPGDITMDGYFLNHARNQPEANYPHVRFPNLGTPWEGSWDDSTPLPHPLEFPAALQVGNPYAFPIFLWEQAVQDPVLGAAPVTMTALPPLAPNVISSLRRFNRWVGEQFLEIQGDPDIPVLFSPWNGLLRPTEGCFVQFGPQASALSQIVFNQPPVVNDFQPWPQVFDFTNKTVEDKSETPEPMDLQEIDPLAKLEGWGYRIMAVNSEGLSRTVILGAYSGAEAGLDKTDIESIFGPENRPPDLDFDFFIDRTGWGQTGILLRDMCSPSDLRTGHHIPLRLVTPNKDSIVITCELIGQPPLRMASSLKDSAGQVLMDLKDQSRLMEAQAGSTQLTVNLQTWADGDVNTDSSVNSLDLFTFSLEFGKKGKGNPADLDANGGVDPRDLIDLVNGMK